MYPQDGSHVIGSLMETAREIRSRGGICVPVQCDHSKDSDIEHVFERVKKENNGQLDILVNNAFFGNEAFLKERGTPFWEQSLSMWDDINHVGLRNTYICTIYCSKLMVQKERGIIVNISSAGGSVCMFNPAYGIGKPAVDRMAADCALELKKHNVACVSVRPGPVCSESVFAWLRRAEEHGENVENFKTIFERAETPNFVGKCVAALANDPSIMQKTGKALSTLEIANEYGITDENGHGPVTDGKSVFSGFHPRAYPMISVQRQ